MEAFRIALAQLEPELYRKEANLQKAQEIIRQAASQGASVVVFPELYLTGYNLAERAVEFAEAPNGQSIQCVAGIARQHAVVVVMGYAELSPDGQHCYDSAFVVDAQGHLLSSYRKIHLFHDESRWFIPGDTLTLVEAGLGQMGLMICYDLEFPEMARLLALGGAQWITVCTGNMQPNQHLQEIYLQSRAAENRLWVAVANRIGREGEIAFFGRSGVSDPFGQLSIQAGGEECLLFTEIDLSLAEQARLNADYLVDRKPRLYQSLVKA